MEKILTKSRIIFVIVLTIAFSGCYYDKSELLYPNSTNTVDCALVSAKFTADVNPIIQAKCATSGCHDGNSASAFFTYTQINAEKNLINTRVVVEKSMPRDGGLTIDEVSKIKCWIDAGAPNN